MSVEVGLVLVSHSAGLARGLAELAGQMAGDVPIIPAGGLDDGSIGTSYDLIEKAVADLRGQGKSVLLLSDIGSATMTVEAVRDAADDREVVFEDAPFVEGAVAAAVTAQQGEDVYACAASAAASAKVFLDALDLEAPEAGGEGEDSSGVYTRTATVVDEAGLHARPAAVAAGIAGEARGEILLNGAAADSIMMLMALGVKKGDTVTITTEDPTCWATVDKLADAIDAGLD